MSAVTTNVVYAVEIKPSARRASRAVGEWVAQHGRSRRFETKALAREWARTLSAPGRTVWVQDAHPLDDGSTDGYLLARRGRPARSDAAHAQSTLVDT